MIPFGSRIVTLIKRQETLSDASKTVTTFKPYVLSNCSWKASKSFFKTENKAHSTNGVVCLIPEESTTEVPCIGDYMLLGSFSSIPQTFNALKAMLDKNGGVEISAVTDNADPSCPMPHYKCTGA